jgi:hypothetical protein
LGIREIGREVSPTAVSSASSISLGPTAQLKPRMSGAKPLIRETASAIGVPTASVSPLRITTCAMTGRSLSSRTARIACSSSDGYRKVSRMMTSTPPSRSALTRLAKSARASSNPTRPMGSMGTPRGPMDPAT